MNETERYIRTSISVACSTELDPERQSFYFNEIMKLLHEESHSPTPEWIVPLEDSFTVDSISVEVQQTALRVQAVLEIVSKFPSEITCSNILISVSTCSNNDGKHKKIAELDYKSVLIKNLMGAKSVPTKLLLVYVLEYQRDESLAAANIACKNLDNYLK